MGLKKPGYKGYVYLVNFKGELKNSYLVRRNDLFGASTNDWVLLTKDQFLGIAGGQTKYSEVSARELASVKGIQFTDRGLAIFFRNGKERLVQLLKVLKFG